MKTIGKSNTSKNYSTTLILIPILLLIHLACPDPPENKPQLADCPVGQSPCADDSTVCCWDTTSHNFVWEVDTLGGPGSYLRDVTIIDENNIWVVGNIETDSGEYNAAHWDGNEWEMMGIYSNTLDLYSIQYFADNDIWVTSFGLPIHWDGNEWTLFHIQNMGLNVSAGFDSWGTSSSNMYFVGYEGGIVHYDGDSFQQIESGTEVDLLDIWGVSETEIWVSGKETGGSVVLYYNGSTWNTFYEWDTNLDEYTTPTDNILLTISSSWASLSNDSLVVVGGWGVFHVSKETKSTRWAFERRWDFDDSLMGYPLKVRGNAWNNIFVCGTRNTILHYNGNSWQHFSEFYDEWGVWLKSICLYDDIVIIVGGNLVVRGINTR